MCLWAIYIFPGSVHSCSKIDRPILEIYKSLTDIWVLEMVERTLWLCFGHKEAAHFHFWEYINGNQTFKLDSHRPFICSAPFLPLSYPFGSLCRLPLPAEGKGEQGQVRRLQNKCVPLSIYFIYDSHICSILSFDWTREKRKSLKSIQMSSKVKVNWSWEGKGKGAGFFIMLECVGYIPCSTVF
jgi:hypothetical protein